MTRRTVTPLAALLLATGLSSAPALAATPPAALEISIGGIGPGVDPNAFRKVKLVLAEALYSGTIDYFDVYGYGKEGGFSACVKQGQFAAEGSFDRLVRTLQRIKPDRSTTFYNLERVAQCQYPTAETN